MCRLVFVSQQHPSVMEGDAIAPPQVLKVKNSKISLALGPAGLEIVSFI